MRGEAAQQLGYSNLPVPTIHSAGNRNRGSLRRWSADPRSTAM